ncbi:MAG: hypothetical protein J5980_04930 [Muribaculaceae bacterium]|nr:hypothetical protein [Muribaculaceae bacterium]
MDDNRKSKIAALLLTLLWLVGTVLVMLYTHLHYEYPPKGAELAQLKQDTIMFGGEFVELGNLPDLSQNEQMELDTPTPTEQQSEQPDVEGDDLDDAGEPAPKPEPKPVVAAKQESPMKVKEKPKEEQPKKTGPAKSTKPEAKQEQVKRGKETTTPKTDRVKDAFGKSTGTTNSKTGSPAGNANTGERSGQPGISGLVGYTAEYWGRPHSKWTGKVNVQVRVNPRGKVIEAHAVSGSGEAWAHPEVRRSCEQAARESAFSVPKNRTSEGIGTITWRFI